MVVIEEKKAKKVPCLTSLFVSVPFADKQLFRILIHLHGSVYDKKSGTFEFPPSSLQFLVKLFTAKDDVKFIPLKEERKTKDKFLMVNI